MKDIERAQNMILNQYRVNEKYMEDVSDKAVG